MHYQDKTKEELLIELQELQQKYDSLKSAFDKELLGNEENKYDLERIIYASKEFSLFSDYSFDHSRILQTLLDISGAKYASFNIFDENGLDFTTVAVAGISENIKKGMLLLGFDPMNKKWKHDPIRAEKIKNQTITRFDSLNDLTGDVISKSVVSIIEKIFGIGETFVVSLVKENKIVGDFTLLFNKGETLSNKKFVDLYSYMVGMFLERKTLTNSLRISEAKHSSMIANISDVIVILGADGTVKYKSRNIEKYFGWKPEDLIDTNVWLTVHPEDLERIQNEFNLLLQKDNAERTTECRYKCKDGRYKPIQLSAINLIHDPVIQGLLVNYHDITERKQAEKDIKILADALKSINDGVSITDLEDNIIFVNDSFLRIYGYSREELIGRSIDFVRSPNNPSEVIKEIKTSTLNGRWDGELLNTRKDGTEFPISLTTSVVRGEKGIPIALIGVFVDITDRRLAQKALRESEEKYRIIFENVQDVFYQTDLTGIIHEISPSIKHFSEFNRDELIGKSVENIYYNLDDRIGLIDSLMKNGEIRDHELILKTKDGNIKYVSINARLVSDSYGIPNRIDGALRDITERKQAEAEVKLKNDQLLIANADKDRFISILAHDLRTPFSVLLGLSDLLKENIRVYDIDKIEQFIDQICIFTKNTYELFEDILMWAQSQSNRLPFMPNEINFSAIFKEVYNILNPSAEAKNISINYLETKEIPLYADSNMVKTILRNLISNAIKFTRPFGRIDIKTNFNDLNVLISVTDNGVGIDRESQNKLFDISQIHTKTGTANEMGTGLGLVLCKDFVEKHGGKIWVESEIGKGSEFKFSLPLLRGNV